MELLRSFSVGSVYQNIAFYALLILLFNVLLVLFKAADEKTDAF
jgi:hypothetical protein